MKKKFKKSEIIWFDHALKILVYLLHVERASQPLAERAIQKINN